MSNFNPLIEKITNFAQTYEAAGDTLQEARICFYDSLACAFLALEHSQAQNFCALPYIKNSSGSVGVIGTDIKTNVIDATLLNGALIRWLDFNDTWLAKEWGHPSDHLSIILALILEFEGLKTYVFVFRLFHHKSIIIAVLSFPQ